MTPETMQAVAERLGARYAYDPRHPYITRGWMRVSDGDLLLAMLNKAAEMGESIQLGKANGRCWCVVEPEVGTEYHSTINKKASTYLEAVALAFEQLPVKP